MEQIYRIFDTRNTTRGRGTSLGNKKGSIEEMGSEWFQEDLRSFRGSRAALGGSEGLRGSEAKKPQKLKNRTYICATDSKPLAMLNLYS